MQVTSIEILEEFNGNIDDLCQEVIDLRNQNNELDKQNSELKEINKEVCTS